ncbi:histone acetylation protein-domain-containing protein [Tuber indicum]|nr:histone acetylation protein-domain-containing protein [Tuber indicum]
MSSSAESSTMPKKSPPPTGGPVDDPLASLLSSLLPTTLSLKLYHISTPTSRYFPLFSSPPNQDPHRTTLESHFLVLSHENVLVFAIEVLIYTVPKQHARTFFISKADSSGYLPSNISSFATETGERKSTLRTISTAFIKYLFDTARRADPHLTATISLFARSQSQYLFPNSAENSKKHVLTDRGLIAWWGKVLDPVLQEYASSGGRGYLLVPGSDAGQTRSMIPSVAEGGVKWINGHPFKLNLDNDISVREVIPHFPDDPKARYLDELNGVAGSKDAGIGGGGKVKERAAGWRDIKTIDQFWELMSFRQECSLGRCVGFLWVVVEGVKKERKMTATSLSGEGIPEDEVVLSPISATGPTFSENILSAAATASNNSQEISPTESVGPLDFTTTSIPPPTETPTPASTPPSPASPRKRRSSSTTSFQPSKKKIRALSFSSAPSSATAPLIPPLLTLDEKAYVRTIDSLLNHSDFGDIESAKRGTRKWIESVQPGVAEKGDWGVDVVGLVKVVENGRGENGNGTRAGGVAVNTLSAGLVRRKSSTPGNGVNLLDAGLVRKKSKAADEKLPGVTEEQERNGVNVLSGSLLRRGPKSREGAKGEETRVNALPTNLVRKKPKVGE